VTFRTEIRADADTDVGAAVERLRRDAERAGVSAVDAGLLATSVEQTLSSLVARGRDMAGVTTHLNAEKTFKDQSYEVKLTFGAGGKPSLMKRVMDLLRGR
jgi:hypothetical protein